MELRPWQLLPDEMRTKEVRKYYNILMKHRMWLEMKRVLDVIVAGIMLAVLIIPMGIIALAIRLDSPGPVFFRQARVTQYGRIFRIYKFRTMVDNASKLGAAVTVDNDSRITKVGAFLRKYRMLRSILRRCMRHFFCRQDLHQGQVLLIRMRTSFLVRLLMKKVQIIYI